MQVFEEVVCVCLLNVRTIELQRHETDTREDQDTEINLADKLVLLAPGPSREGIESVQVLPFRVVSNAFYVC